MTPLQRTAAQSKHRATTNLMSEHSIKDTIGAAPRFIDADQLEALRAFRATLERLGVQRESVSSDYARKQLRGQVANYAADPSDENLARLVELAQRANFIDNDVRLRSHIVDAIRSVSAQIRPSIERMLHQGLQVASAQAEKVTAEENERAKKLIGRPLSHSEIIETALAPVHALQSILEEVKRSERISPELIDKIISDYALPAAT